MAKAKAQPSSEPMKYKPRIATNPEARENQIISAAYDLAEKQIREGTVSSQVLTHFLKQGTIQAKIELEILKKENALIEAKTKKIQSEEKSEEMYQDVIKALQRYKGLGDCNDPEDEY